MDTSALNTPCTGRNEEEEASDTKNREARTSNGKILPAFFGSSFVTVCATKKREICNNYKVYKSNKFKADRNT